MMDVQSSWCHDASGQTGPLLNAEHQMDRNAALCLNGGSGCESISHTLMK